MTVVILCFNLHHRIWLFLSLSSTASPQAIFCLTLSVQKIVLSTSPACLQFFSPSTSRNGLLPLPLSWQCVFLYNSFYNLFTSHFDSFNGLPMELSNIENNQSLISLLSESSSQNVSIQQLQLYQHRNKAEYIRIVQGKVYSSLRVRCYTICDFSFRNARTGGLRIQNMHDNNSFSTDGNPDAASVELVNKKGQGDETMSQTAATW